MYFECFERGLKPLIIIETKPQIKEGLFLAAPASGAKGGSFQWEPLKQIGSRMMYVKLNNAELE